ncbi:MAG: hypothetical protein GY927_08295 [bacterium]|nr:hypothetical protein [bacterium]
MVKMSDTDEGGKFPRLSDVTESGEAALHTTQINLSPEAFERFADVFEGAVRRWERIVYPAMFVMVLVMAYGFFLMFNLANDMRVIAQQIAPMAGHMSVLTKKMGHLTGSIENMGKDMNVIAKVMPEMNEKLSEMTAMRVQVEVMNKRMEFMNVHMEGMNQQMSTMNSRMYVMTGSVAQMNRTVGRPMNFMNSFMPW